MTATEFNEKYKDFLEEGHYGLDINTTLVVMYLDSIFQDLIKIPGFKYKQIKLKFKMVRFYSTLGLILSDTIEKEIENIIKSIDGKSK